MLFKSFPNILMADAKITRPIGIYILVNIDLLDCRMEWPAAWRGNLLLEYVEEYGASPLYIAISGGIWLIVGLFLALELVAGKNLGKDSGNLCYSWLYSLVLVRSAGSAGTPCQLAVCSDRKYFFPACCILYILFSQ